MHIADQITERQLIISALRTFEVWVERNVLNRHDYPRLAQVLRMAANLLERDGEKDVDGGTDQIPE